MTANETVREVCAESKDWDNHSWLGVNEHEYVVEIADRILSAHEREIKRMHECCDALEDELDKEGAEIAHLKSALLDAIARTCNRDHGECARCVREGVFNCPARRWKAAMDGEAKEAK